MSSSDVPEAAYANTVRALDAFDATIAEYALLLESQNRRLDAHDISGIDLAWSRGDRLARDARAYGQQLSAMWEAIVTHRYAGPLTSELRRRISAVERGALAVSRSAAQLMARCSEAQATASAQLTESPSFNTDASVVGRGLYSAEQSRPMLFDTVR